MDQINASKHVNNLSNVGFVYADIKWQWMILFQKREVNIVMTYETLKWHLLELLKCRI